MVRAVDESIQSRLSQHRIRKKRGHAPGFLGGQLARDIEPRDPDEFVLADIEQADVQGHSHAVGFSWVVLWMPRLLRLNLVDSLLT